MSWNPGAIANIEAWYKADSLALSDGTAVSSWSDSSGNGFTASQGTGSKQPVFHTNQINGLPALAFTAASSQDMTSGADMSFATAGLTVFLVCNPSSVTTLQAVVGSNAASGLWVRIGTTSHLRLDNGTTGNIATGTYTAATGWQIIAMSYGNSGTSAWAQYVNGSLKDSGTSSAILATGKTLEIGAGNSSNYLGGSIAEIITYERVLSATERAQVDSYFQDRYGIAVSDYTLSGSLALRSRAPRTFPSVRRVSQQLLPAAGDAWPQPKRAARPLVRLSRPVKLAVPSAHEPPPAAARARQGSRPRVVAAGRGRLQTPLGVHESPVAARGARALRPRLVAVFRGRQVAAVPAQVTVLKPVWPNRLQVGRRMAAIVRGRRVGAVPVQETSPPASRRQSGWRLAIVRGRQSVRVPSQDSPPSVGRGPRRWPLARTHHQAAAAPLSPTIPSQPLLVPMTRRSVRKLLGRLIRRQAVPAGWQPPAPPVLAEAVAGDALATNVYAADMLASVAVAGDAPATQSYDTEAL